MARRPRRDDIYGADEKDNEPSLSTAWYSVWLSLNVHFHMLILDGVYSGGTSGLPLRFRQVKAPSGNELTQLVHTIASRVARNLERQGFGGNPGMHKVN